MSIIPEIPEMPIIPPKGMDGSDRLEEGLEYSEGNGEVRKRVERDFGEKRL